MSGIYFCFSDECGDYKLNMSDNQLKIHPYYIRTTLIMNAQEWKLLSAEFKQLKIRYGLPIAKEIKWSHVWTLRVHQEQNRQFPSDHELKFLEKYTYSKLIDFVEESLQIINILKEKRIIATYTKNEKASSINEKHMLHFHLQEHMQRIEMELQKNENNLGVLFFDPVNQKKNELFRKVYSELYENGDFVNSYKFIKDSLNIENSHHSVGIQIADYISGAFSSVLKANSSNNYLRGVKMYFKNIHPNLRRDPEGRVQGYGIREVPSNRILRNWLIKKLSKYNPK